MKFFTADTHFDHALKTQRPFSVEDWNAHMLAQINYKVKRNDTLYILGDFALRRPGYWRQQINCRHVKLVRGNHDPLQKCRNVFGGNFLESPEIYTRIGGVKTHLSHYPHAFWPGSHRGYYHLYGHTHNQREATLDAIWPQRRSMDVSPDSYNARFGDFSVWSEDEIRRTLMNREGHDLVSFYKELQGV
jgi:calcineurin-like phosphoesterase family protein